MIENRERQTILSAEQRKLLAARLRQGRGDGSATGIPRRPHGMEEIPLSFGQEQLWFIDQLAPGLPTYNIAGAVDLRGPLDIVLLGRALDAIVARHEALRSRLVSVEGRPHQVIDPPRPVELPLVDLSNLEPRVRDEELRRLSVAEASSPFFLDKGPLMRARLVRLAEDEHKLLLVVHHAVFDGWSFGILLQELAALYESHVTGQTPALPELAVQFADYAVWDRERLRGEQLDRLVEYWQGALQGAPVLQMPIDRPRPPVQTYAGAIEHIDIDGVVLDSLKALGRRQGTTLFMTLLGAFQVLLQRYSGQDDIVVGTVSANRGRPELAPLIAYLVNTLAIRTDLSGDPSFTDVLERTKTATLGAYAHQDLPFAKLVDALRITRDPSRSPVFQVGFTLAENARQVLRAGGLTLVPEVIDLPVAKFDLNVAAEEMDGSLHVTATYASAIFDGATIQRLLGNFRTLLEGIAQDPSQRVSRLPLLSPAERRRELEEWNATAMPWPARCLHERFEEQVAATPDRVAVEMDGDGLTYAALNAQANQVARRLRALGVGPEKLVGVAMQRSLKRIVALLGVLKAGGGYVPLDPEYPSERLAFMMQDADVSVVLTDTASAPALPPTDAPILTLDREWQTIAGLEDDDPGFAVDPSNVAYVIYTSGSTGLPKGVVIEHASATNFARAEIHHWPVGPGDRILQFASLNFDVSVFDMFVALLSGATLVLSTTETLLSPPRLAGLIRRERITVMCLPPAVLNLLTGEEFPSLRVVIAGGEAFSAALVRRWLRPGLRFVNGYGPTETTVGATMFECADDGIDPPPIGLPLANYRAYVLDQHLNIVPVGVPGELHIGGAGVARGYLNRPELTQARFIADPYSDAPNARLYKTGDLVRRLLDGNLQFLGRLDGQVKIRGYRIELGEIEAVLSQHAAVAQAVVVVSTDRAGDKQLVAYARRESNAAAVDASELRRHLATRLPGYMLPAHIVILDSFPLNASGKVVRSALPAPADAVGCATHVAPRTIVEAVVADMFASLLNVEQVGVDDNFFDLGGNSLQAMRLAALLRKELAVDTDVTAIFLAPTTAQLTTLLRDKFGLSDESLGEEDLDALREPAVEDRRPATVDATRSAAAPLVHLAGAPEQPPLFAVHAVAGTVHAYAALARELASTFSVYGIEAAGLHEGTVPATSFAEMVSRYLDAIRGFQPHGPYRLAGWSMGGVVASELARRLEDAGEEIALLALLDAPPVPSTSADLSASEMAAFFLSDAGRTLGRVVDGAPDPATSTASEQLRWLASSALGAAEDGAFQADIERRFDVFQAHVRLIAGYDPRVVRAPTLVVSAEESTPLERWSPAPVANVRSVAVPGDHYTFLQPPSVSRVADAIRAAEGASIG